MAALVTTVPILIAVALGLLVGMFKGGSIENLTQWRPASAEVAGAGLAAVVLSDLIPLSNLFLTLIYYAGLGALLYAAWMNRRVGGMVVIALGLFLNLLAAFPNGGTPVSPEALIESGIVKAEDLDTAVLSGARHIRDKDHVLGFLGDNYLLPGGLIVSVGDVLTWLGMALATQSIVRRRQVRIGRSDAPPRRNPVNTPATYQEALSTLGMGPASNPNESLDPPGTGRPQTGLVRRLPPVELPQNPAVVPVIEPAGVIKPLPDEGESVVRILPGPPARTGDTADTEIPAEAPAPAEGGTDRNLMVPRITSTVHGEPHPAEAANAQGSGSAPASVEASVDASLGANGDPASKVAPAAAGGVSPVRIDSLTQPPNADSSINEGVRLIRITDNDPAASSAPPSAAEALDSTPPPAKAAEGSGGRRSWFPKRDHPKPGHPKPDPPEPHQADSPPEGDSAGDDVGTPSAEVSIADTSDEVLDSIDDADTPALAQLLDSAEFEVLVVEPPTGEFESVRVLVDPGSELVASDGETALAETRPEPGTAGSESVDGDDESGPRTEAVAAVDLSTTSEVTGLVEIIEIEAADPRAEAEKISASLLEDEWDAPALIVRRTQKPKSTNWFRRKPKDET